MPTAFRKGTVDQSYFGQVSTSRYVMVTTAAAQLLTIGSGLSALHLFNTGSGQLIWGDSGIAVNSGAYLFVNAGRTFENLQGPFPLYLRAESVQTLVSVTEFRR